MSIRFDDQVVIVTGAGNGLGKCHAIELANRGAKVVVNDLGGAKDGTGPSSPAAQAVVAEIENKGGEAIANGANVADYGQVEAMVAAAMEKWGRVDILINNAGILRDKSFAKMPLDDFDLVMNVHLMGSVNCTKAVWNIMREQNYGRIVMTTSSSGMYGNFGQSNYGAAKMAVLGLMNTLTIEGAKNDVRINALGPGAATRMTADLLPKEVIELMTVEPVTAAALALCHKDAPSNVILNAAAGSYSVTRWQETVSVWLPADKQNVDGVVEHWREIADTTTYQDINNGGDHTLKQVTAAGRGLGLI